MTDQTPEASAVEALAKEIAKHTRSHLAPEFCTADCLARGLASDWLAEHTRRAQAQAWDEALAHVWELADPVNTVVESPSTKRVNTLADIEQAKRENPYRENGDSRG